MKSPFCYIDFQLSKSTYLSNGDMISVTIPESDLKWLASENDGYKPKKTSQKFKAEEEEAASGGSHFSHSGTGSNADSSGSSYDDDVDPDDPDYEEGDENFDEYDDIEYYDDDWEGDY